jgi:Putative peptidoglycan binding domain
MIIMKKLTSLLIGCSLALAGAALAQQPVEQQSPTKGKRAPEKAHETQAQPKPNAAKPPAPPATHQGAPQQHGAAHDAGAMKEQGAAHEHAATNEPGAGKGGGRSAMPLRGGSGVPVPPGGPLGSGPKAPAHQESATAPKTNVSGESADTSTPSARQQRIEQRRKGMKGQAAAPETSTNPAAPGAGAAGAGAASSVPAAGQQNAQAKAGAKGKKPDPQQVQQVKSQHTSFRAQPKPQQVQAVTFNQNHRIEGSDRWQGQHYEVFRSYHPEWHDQGWYHSHYNRVELIAGGYYFFNNGYWFPAWGYSPSAQYYAYDAPIYVGQRAVPPDQVIADVQALLQQMGYYTGEVDGLLGPLTREALTAYQTDQGLTTTAVIDQPTLDSLGLA